MAIFGTAIIYVPLQRNAFNLRFLLDAISYFIKVPLTKAFFWNIFPQYFHEAMYATLCIIYNTNNKEYIYLPMTRIYLFYTIAYSG